MKIGYYNFFFDSLLLDVGLVLYAYKVFELNSVNFWNFVFVAILPTCWSFCVIN